MATVEIDQSVCQGSGICELVAGHLFVLGSEGVAELLESALDSSQLVDAATDAMSSCPSAAIAVNHD